MIRTNVNIWCLEINVGSPWKSLKSPRMLFDDYSGPLTVEAGCAIQCCCVSFWWIERVMPFDVRHDDEVRAAAASNKTELSRVTRELEAARATLAQHKMSADSVNSQVSLLQSLMAATHAQETCTRSLHEKFVACLSQFLAPKQLSGQSRCTVCGTCRTVSVLV